jgi:hypothetical protein
MKGWSARKMGGGGGCLITALLFITTAVAAAASVPYSLTSPQALWNTAEISVGREEKISRAGFKLAIEVQSKGRVTHDE